MNGSPAQLPSLADDNQCERTASVADGDFLVALLTRILWRVHRVHYRNLDTMRFSRVSAAPIRFAREYLGVWATDLMAKAFGSGCYPGSAGIAAQQLAAVVTAAPDLARLY